MSAKDPRDEPANITCGEWDDMREASHKQARLFADSINKAREETMSLAQLAGAQNACLRSVLRVLERLGDGSFPPKERASLDQDVAELEKRFRDLWKRIADLPGT